MLRHKNKEKFEDFIWHWFLVIGYRLKNVYQLSENYLRTGKVPLQ